MKLQFDSDLDYQSEAISSIVDIFKGQSVARSEFTVSSKIDDVGTVGTLITSTGIGNRLQLDSEDLLKNVQAIQLKNGLEQSKTLSEGNYNFTVEMETGTGKTYVYLRTIFELNAKYGFTKFMIIVPSVAIKEGVMKSINIMSEHFKGLYDNVIFKAYEYKSQKLDVLAQALKEVYSKVDPKYGETEVKVIGTRHGEKLYETLVTREEMLRSEDMGNYFRIPCDNRDLNYDKFFTEGDDAISRTEDYHSHNTRRLDVEGMKELLLKLNFIREDLGLQARAKSRDYRSE